MFGNCHYVYHATAATAQFHRPFVTPSSCLRNWTPRHLCDCHPYKKKVSSPITFILFKDRGVKKVLIYICKYCKISLSLYNTCIYQNREKKKEKIWGNIKMEYFMFLNVFLNLIFCRIKSLKWTKLCNMNLITVTNKNKREISNSYFYTQIYIPALQ